MKLRRNSPSKASGSQAFLPQDRDPQRLSTRGQVNDGFNAQGDVCAMCEEPLALADAGRRIERHVDGRPIVPDNLVVPCPSCDVEPHQ